MAMSEIRKLFLNFTSLSFGYLFIIIIDNNFLLTIFLTCLLLLLLLLLLELDD